MSDEPKTLAGQPHKRTAGAWSYYTTVQAVTQEQIEELLDSHARKAHGMVKFEDVRGLALSFDGEPATLFVVVPNEKPRLLIAVGALRRAAQGVDYILRDKGLDERSVLARREVLEEVSAGIRRTWLELFPGQAEATAAPGFGGLVPEAVDDPAPPPGKWYDPRDLALLDALRAIRKSIADNAAPGWPVGLVELDAAIRNFEHLAEVRRG